MVFRIEFEDANRRLPGEGQSKLLKTDSDLVRKLQNIRNELQQRSREGMKAGDRPWHIELCDRSDRSDDAKLISRAQELEGTVVDLSCGIMNGRAVVLHCPPVTDYGPTHVTIVYFPFGAPSWVQEQLDDIVTKA